MGKANDNEYGDTLTLELDDGSTVECVVVTIFDVEDKQYIALLPMNAKGEIEEDAPVYLYRFNDLGNDEVDLESIEDDEEFEKVSDAYDEILDEEEFDELFDGI